MKLKSLSVNSTRTITCPYETEEPKAEFTIADMLPLNIRTELKDGYSDFEKGADGRSKASFRFGSRNIEIVRHGLKGLKNLEGEDGKPVELKQVTRDGRLVIAEETLQALSIPLMQDGFDTLIDWLAGEIWSANTVSKADAQVFPSQPR